MSPIDELEQVCMKQLREGVPPDVIVAAIESRLKISAREDRLELASLLNPFLTIANRDRDARQLADGMIQEFPDDVRFPIIRANAYLYDEQDFEAALRCIDVAIERAYRSGQRRREALGYKARILLKIGRGDLLSDVLEEIMSLRLEKGAIDVGSERDFVDRAPPGLIRNDVLDRYNEFRPKRSTDTSADQVPRFELPDEGI
jgi:hypothetical protein